MQGGGLFPFDPGSPVSLQPFNLNVLYARDPLRFLPFASEDTGVGDAWLISSPTPLYVDTYTCQPWSVLQHMTTMHCNVYAVWHSAHVPVRATSKALVESSQPSRFAFVPKRGVRVRNLVYGLLFQPASVALAGLSLTRETGELASLTGQYDPDTAGIQLRFSNDVFAVHTVGGHATLVTSTVLQPDLLTAITTI